MRRRSVALVAFSSVALTAAQGCVGTLSRSDGEGPLPPSLSRSVGPCSEVGGGAGGVILRKGDGPGYLLATSHSAVALELTEEPTPDLAGARIAGDSLYRLHGDDLERREIVGASRLSKPTRVATAPGARLFAVLAADPEAGSTTDTVALVGPSGVLVGPAGGVLETVWQGEALAVDLDPVRAAVWIVGRAPLASIDCVSLADRRVLFRAPLPRELESASVRIVRSGPGVVVYALDRPIEAALLLAPEAGVARLLVASKSVDDARGSYDDASLPPLLLPPGRFEEERLSVSLPPENEQHRGRVACLGQGRFAVIDDRSSWVGLTIDVVTTPAEPDVAPLRTSYVAPADWPRVVEGVGWDAGGAFLTSGDTRLVLGTKSAEAEGTHPVGDALRRGTNHAINGVLVVGEVAVTIALGGGVVGLCLVALPVGVAVAPILLIGEAVAKASR